MPAGRTKAISKKAASRRKPMKRRASSVPDPVALEVFSNALLSVAEEMGAALIRTAYSTNIKERQDASDGHIRRRRPPHRPGPSTSPCIWAQC